MVRRWAELEPLLAGDLDARRGERAASLSRNLDRRRSDDLQHTEAVFTQLRRTLETALAGDRAQCS